MVKKAKKLREAVKLGKHHKAARLMSVMKPGKVERALLGVDADLVSEASRILHGWATFVRNGLVCPGELQRVGPGTPVDDPGLSSGIDEGVQPSHTTYFEGG